MGRVFRGEDLGTGDTVRKSLRFAADYYVPARPLSRGYADGTVEALRRFSAGIPPDLRDDALEDVHPDAATVPVRDPSPVWGLEHLDGALDFAGFGEGGGLARVSLLLDEAAFQPRDWTPEKRTRLLDFLESLTILLRPRVAYADYGHGPRGPPEEERVDRVAWASMLPDAWTADRRLPVPAARHVDGYRMFVLSENPAESASAAEAAWAAAWNLR